MNWPSPPLPRKLPHLARAMQLSPTGDGNALCFHRSAAFVLDVPGAALCFGTLRGATEDEAREIGPAASPVPFIHCWAEFGGAVWAPTLIERHGGELIPLPRADYYEFNAVRDARHMSRPELLALARLHRFRALTFTGKPLACGTPFGRVLLDAAGIAYALSPGRGVIPQPEESTACTPSSS